MIECEINTENVTLKLIVILRKAPGKRVLPSDASKRQYKRKSSEAFHILATACVVSKNQDVF